MNYPQIKPTLNLDFSNTKTLDPRINFRRGTPGAYYDGKTHAKAEENLISFSEDFSQWGKAANLLDPSLVQDASPVGTDAYKLICGSTNASHAYAHMLLSKENYLTSYSIYIKADGFNYAWIGFCYDNSTQYQSFVVDLTSGQILDQYTRNRGNLIGVNVVSSGNDWYRIEFISDGHVANYLAIGGVGDPSTDFNSDGRPFFQGDGTSGILVWGAQVEDRGSVTAYTPTNGTPVTKYQPQLMFASPDQPRFDHDPITGESKGLLIEEQRTNLIAYSEDFRPAYLISPWVTNDASIKTDCVIAPDGTLTADKLVENTNAAQHLVAQLFNFQSGTSYTFSIFAKKGESESMFFNITNLANVLGSQPVYAKADLNDGTIQLLSGNDASVGSENVGNGWFRFTITGTCTVTASAWLGVRTYDSTGSITNYLGDGRSGLYIWGAQLEEGSFPTSYIKTTGATAGTVRSADNASITGENFSSWYRQDEGSLYSEVNTFAGSTVSRISMSDGTSSNRIFISNGINPLYVKKNGDIQVKEDSSAVVNVYSKRAAGLKKDDFALSIDGGNPLVDTSGDLPLVDRLAFSASHASVNYVNGHIKKLSYYPQRLTNEQLQQLTK